MKILPAVLAASLLANAAAIVVYLAQSADAAKTSASAASKIAPRVTVAASDDALRAALAKGDAAALAAAGVPADVARDLALGRSVARIVDKSRAAQSKGATDSRWWRSRATTPAGREQQLAVKREFNDALAAAFGPDAGGLSAADGGQLDFLSPEKRAALRRITQDYDEMMAAVSGGGIQLASDKEKLRLLKAERERDIAGLLTPEEQLAYDMRTSPTAGMVRARYGDGIETEDDFRKIYTLQKAFDDKYPLDAMNGRVTPDLMKQRNDAQRQLQDDIRVALGEDKYAALRRATDSDLRTVDSLVSRLNLPPATTNQVAAARDNFAAESQRINSNTALPAPERRTQLQDLGTRAKNDLVRTLGAEAADAYAQRSPWVNMLQSGMAFATSPQPNSPAGLGVGQSVYPVMPTGTPGSPATGRVVLSGSTSSTEAPVHDFFLGPAGGGERQNVQVMTFTTTGDAGAPIEKKVIVSPAPVPPPKQ